MDVAGWTLSVFPGGMNTSRINPLSVDSTQLHYHFYFSDLSAGAEASRRETIEVNCGIVREDFGICESTQLCLRRLLAGPLKPTARAVGGLLSGQSKSGADVDAVVE